MTKIIGIKAINYVSKKTNRPVVGMEIHYTYEDAHAVGVLTDKTSVSQKVCMESGIDCTNDSDIRLLVGKTVKFFTHPVYHSVTGFQTEK